MSDGDKHDPQSLPAAEPLLVCAECGAPLAPGEYEAHLRAAHRLYYFRGVRRPYTETLAHLLNLLAAPTPDAEAWPVLKGLVRDRIGGGADAVLAALLGALLSRVDDDARPAVVEGLADVLARDDDARLTVALAGAGEAPPRWLALAVIARQAPPFDPALLTPLRSLLMDRRPPAEAQLAAFAALMRSAGPESKVVAELLPKLVAGLGKKRAVDRLRELERRGGKSSAIDALAAKLEERMRMSCPRCPAELRRPAMVRHLWDEHRLVLDGRTVRDPWSVLEDWVTEYRRAGDAALLERCRLRGRQLDPEEGSFRVHRLLMRHGAGDAEAVRGLTAHAQERHASLCPWCYALAPQPREAPPLAVNLRPGRLSAGGYAVETTASGIFHRLEVRAPGRVLYRGRGGRWRPTRRGATLLLAGPLTALTLAAAVAWGGTGPELLLPVGALSALALMTLLLVRRLWPAAGAPPKRLVRHAWLVLAPRLHEPDFNPDDSAFLAGLALVTPPGAFRQERAPLLTSLLKRTEDAVAAGVGPPGHLAALRRLMVEDAAAFGADPVPLVADQLARCFDGRLPLVYAEHLLSGWRSGWWTRGNLVRMRVLLCDRAFEAGFEVSNLLDAGQTAPALGDVLGAGDPLTHHPSPPGGEGWWVRGLAALRLVWSLRAARPWDHCGEARTVFDLAADAAHADLLGRRPDLLLWQRDGAWVVAAEGGEEPMRPAEILVCAGGVWLQEVRFTAPPAVVGVWHSMFGGELALGGRRFRGSGDFDALARRMERWFRFAFGDLLPRTPAVRAWRSPERAAILRAWGAAPCRECGRFLLPRVGAVGVALDETQG